MTHRNPHCNDTRNMEAEASGVQAAASVPMPLLPSYVPLTLRHALCEARERLHAIYGSRLRRVVLYGSQARGDAREESDVDVLVVLDDVPNAYQEIKRMGDLKMDLFERYRLYVSLHPYAEEAYQDTRRPFMWKVHAEGIELEGREREAP